MDIDSAKAFKAPLEAAVAELSRAVLVAQTGCSAGEFLSVRRSIGHLIADADVLLHDSIYVEHPELNYLKGAG